jgi:malonate transporter
MPAAIQSRASTPAIPPARTSLVGLGLSVEGMRSNLAASVVLAAVKLVIMPLIVYGLCVSSSLKPLYTIAAVVCAAKTVYILAGEYKVEEPLVAATVSITTLLSVATLLGWLYAL